VAEEYYVLRRQLWQVDYPNGGVVWIPPCHYEYLDPKGNATKTMNRAALFTSRGLALAFLAADCKVFTGGWFRPYRILASDALRIRKHWLKLNARELFGISARAPLPIVADRYEEEGMAMEAELLRRKS
jgi:hypothetical protein